MGKFHSNGKARAKIDDWFRSPALDQLEELTFGDGHMQSLPTSALRLAPTLRVAKFRNCHFPPLNDAPALILPRLKNLELIAVCLSKGDMERLLHGYTALEYLRLQAINGLTTFVSGLFMCVAGAAGRHHKRWTMVWSSRTHLHLRDYL